MQLIRKINIIIFLCSFILALSSCRPDTKGKEKIFIRVETQANQSQVGQKVQFSLRMRLPQVKWRINPFVEGYYLLLAPKTWPVLQYALNKIKTMHQSDDQDLSDDGPWLMQGSFVAVEERYFMRHIKGLLYLEKGDKVSFWKEFAQKDQIEFKKKLVKFAIFALKQQKHNKNIIRKQLRSYGLSNDQAFQQASADLIAQLWRFYSSHFKNLIPGFSLTKNSFATLELPHPDHDPPSQGIIVGAWTMRFYRPGHYSIPVPMVHDHQDNQRLGGKSAKVKVLSPFAKSEKPRWSLLRPWLGPEKNYWLILVIIFIFVFMALLTAFWLIKAKQEKKKLEMEPINAKLDLFHALNDLVRDINSVDSKDFDQDFSLRAATQMSYHLRHYLERVLDIPALESDTETLLADMQANKKVQKVLERAVVKNEKRTWEELTKILSVLDLVKYAKDRANQQSLVSMIEVMKHWARAIDNELEREKSGQYGV